MQDAITKACKTASLSVEQVQAVQPYAAFLIANEQPNLRDFTEREFIDALAKQLNRFLALSNRDKHTALNLLNADASMQVVNN